MSAPPCAPPDPNPYAPALPTPPGACDCHNHVFGPADRFPYGSQRSYTPPDAPLEMYNAMHAAIGISRAVAVQGSAHGTDNRAMLDALERQPDRMRGVAVVAPDIADAELRRMAALGVTGLRFNHMFVDGALHMKGGVTIDNFFEMQDRMIDLGLHLQLWIDARDLPDLWPRLSEARVPIMVDHMGRVQTQHGVEHPGFQLLAKLVGEGRLWVKLSGCYRISDAHPDYADARPFHEALVAANPDQCVWGTDWPHPRQEAAMPNVGLLLDLFNEWTPDAANRRKILVDNPARFYGFPPA